jgi:hypothetical protein
LTLVHRGAQGNRARAPRTPLRVAEPASAAGFAVYTPGDPGRHPPQKVRTRSVYACTPICADTLASSSNNPLLQHSFFAPSLYRIKQGVDDGPMAYGHGAAGGLWLYTTPLSPGVTRVVVRRTVPMGTKAPLAVELISRLVIPAHLLLSDVFDGDVLFLHAQERILRSKAPDARAELPAADDDAVAKACATTPWRKAYFMATAEDVGIATVRQWLERVGGGGPFGGAPLPPRIASRRVLLDRWAQHAAHCATCRAAACAASAAARGLSAGAGVAAAAAAAGLVIAGSGDAASLAQAASSPAVLAAAAAAPALGAAAMAANKLDALLHFKDYIHGRT